MSKRRACGVLEFQRSTCYYRSVADEQAALRIRLRDLAQARVSFGYRRLHILMQLGKERGLPKTIRVDNGPEFKSKRLDQWAYLNGVELDFSRRGKPTDNGLIEAFNGRLRQECLNESWFLSLEDAREKTETWRKYYNSERPHGALGNLAPLEYVSLVK